MKAHSALRLLAAMSAAAWVLAVATGNTGGGLMHVLAPLAMLAFFAQTRMQVALTPFEAWRVREEARRAERNR